MSDEKSVKKFIENHGKGLTIADEHCLWELYDDIRTQRDAEWKEKIELVVDEWRYTCYEGLCVSIITKEDANELISKLKSAMEAK